MYFATGDLELDLLCSIGDLDLLFLEGVWLSLILNGFCRTASVLANEVLLGDLDLLFFLMSAMLMEGIDEIIKWFEVLCY